MTNQRRQSDGGSPAGGRRRAGLKQSQVWRSIYRSQAADTPQGQSEHIFNSLALHIHPVKVQPHGLRFTYTFCLGGLALATFIILTVTGLLLMFYYVPSTERAFEDIVFLGNRVFLGRLLRNLHRWAAHAMVIAVFLHMCRVFYTGSYKPPRQFNWVVGVVLFILTLLLSYTGYLLPWDQLSYWGINVGVNLTNYVPVLGAPLRFLLLGADTIGQNALLRFYVLHTILLPLVVTVLVAVHFWRVRKDGGISGPL